MKKLVGEEARRAYEESNKRHDAEHAKMLAEAKAEAVRTGKEPFDLEKVKRLWVLMRDPDEYPGETTYATLEFKYYMTNVRTNAAFAELLSELEYGR